MSLKSALMEIAALKSEREALIHQRDLYREGLERFGHHNFAMDCRTGKRDHNPKCCPLCIDFLNH